MKRRGRKLISVMALLLIVAVCGCSEALEPQGGGSSESTYFMPAEEAEHEGTWLQWPHDNTYGKGYRDSLEDIWVEMTYELSLGEKVHIVAYDEKEKKHIEALLKSEGIDMNFVDFFVYPTDDVWIRDNGPVFVNDENGEMVILDWGFNGWGNKTPYAKCDQIPKKVSSALGIERIDLKEVVLEGGAVELDGQGTCLAARSSVTNKNRIGDMTEKEMEAYLRQYYGITNFIWIDGTIDEADVTDFHIDGIAKFYNKNSVITMQENDLLEWGTGETDVERMMDLKNAEGKPYEYIYLPLTKNNVKLADGYNLGYKGSYINFYIGNEVVLVPNYKDANDMKANQVIQELYPDRKVTGIDVRELYQYGGMIHCVTQQQPIVKEK